MALKIKPEDMERLRQLITSEPVVIYARARLEHYQKLHTTPGNHYYRRPYIGAYRWDIFAHICTATPGFSSILYSYLNDDNIEVALRRLIPE